MRLAHAGLCHPASQSWNQMGKWMKKADIGSQGDEKEPVLGVLEEAITWIPASCRTFMPASVLC